MLEELPPALLELARPANGSPLQATMTAPRNSDGHERSIFVRILTNTWNRFRKGAEQAFLPPFRVR
jgi:hypothetical protein